MLRKFYSILLGPEGNVRVAAYGNVLAQIRDSRQCK